MSKISDTIRSSCSTPDLKYGRKGNQIGRFFKGQRTIRAETAAVPLAQRSEEKIDRQRRISTIRVVVGCALGAVIGAAIGGPIGIGVGTVVGAAYVLIGPEAMWRVVQRAGHAVAQHVKDYQAKRATPATG